MKWEETHVNNILSEYQKYELVKHYSHNPLSDHVLLTGSIVEDLGNIYSDYDIFVISKNGKKYSNSVSYSNTLKKWVDVEYFSYAEITELIESINHAAIRQISNWTNISDVSVSNLGVYHKLLVGFSVNDALNWDADIGHLLNKKFLSIEVAKAYIYGARARWTDAVGAFESNKFFDSYHFSRECFKYLLISYLSILGETNPSEKWTYIKSARIKSDPLNVLDLNEDVLYKGFTERWSKELIKINSELMFKLMHYLNCDNFDVPISDIDYLERLEYINDKIYKVSGNGLAHKI